MKITNLKLICYALLFLCNGCGKHADPKIDQALASPLVLFQPLMQDAVTLNSNEAETVRKIIIKYNGKGFVRIESKAPPVADGTFILNNVAFGWFGSYLYLYDDHQKHYCIVEDDNLLKLSVAFNKAIGTNLPHAYPSHEEWPNILNALTRQP